MKSFLHSDKPLLTVMIQASTGERAKELMKKAVEQGAEAIGFQYERLDQAYHSPEFLREFFSMAGDLPIYVTNYPWGAPDDQHEAYAEDLLLLLDCGATLIDIPADLYCVTPRQITYDPAAVEKQKKLAQTIHDRGGEVLFSAHTFIYNNPGETLSIAQEQKNRGADICKIVGAANSEQELRDYLHTTLLLSEKLDAKFLHLCNGTHCGKHRRLNPALGSAMFLCVVEYDDFSTNTQPLLQDARRILESVL